MKEFSCGDVIPGCTATFSGECEDDILTQLGPHAAQTHGMSDVPDDILQQARSAITTC